MVHVEHPSLEVLRLRPPSPPIELGEPSRSILDAIVVRLKVTPEVALQVALTHALACLQRSNPLYLEAAGSHNRAPSDV